MQNNLHDQLLKEIKAINATLAAFNVKARTGRGLTGIGGDQLVIYKLRTAPGQALSGIDRRLPEISEAISQARREATLVRLLRFPPRLEVTHPARKPLRWEGPPAGEPHALLLGRVYDDGARDLWVRFDDSPHVLVAGGTGAGKSVGMANMLTGLCWNTPPDQLRIILIDMKRTDLVPFARLPHVDLLATDEGPAYGALERAHAIMRQRQGTQTATPRLLIVVDEYADLARDKTAMEHAGKLAAQGRSAGINLLVATQHPTAAALGDSTIKNNFLTRCVGKVAGAAAAANATDRPGTHAELLPGKGAFLFVRDEDPVRYQTYLMGEVDIESAITRIGRKWRSVGGYGVATGVATAPAIAGYGVATAPATTSRSPVSAEGGYRDYGDLFPIREGRPLTRREAAAVRELAAGGAFDTQGAFSMRQAMTHVYGSRNTERSNWIREALAGGPDEKIISLRRTG